MKLKPHKPIFVRATIDHAVGPPRMGRIAVAKGQIRQVTPTAEGAFCTSTDSGGFFGACRLDRGWERANPNDGDVAAYAVKANRDTR